MALFIISIHPEFTNNWWRNLFGFEWTWRIYAVFSDLKDKSAPLITRTIRCGPNALWYHDHLRELKCKLRRLERRWNSSKLEIDKHIFHDHSKSYNLAIKHAKETYHKMCNLLNVTQNICSRSLTSWVLLTGQNVSPQILLMKRLQITSLTSSVTKSNG